MIAQVEEIWLFHMNFDNMMKIRKFRKVRGIPSLKKPDVGLCKNCQIAKWERLVLRAKTINLRCPRNCAYSLM